MSSLLNPLHPGTIFLQKKLGVQAVSTTQFTMPPNSTFTYLIVPGSGIIWLNVIGSVSPPRDAATGNPVISPLIYVYNRHSMIVSALINFGLESEFRSPWAGEIDIKVNDPMVSTLVNGTALTIIVDFTFAIIEIAEENYDKYMRLWNGLYNLEMLLGGLKDTDIEGLVWVLKTLRPVVPLPTPLPAQEVTTHPTLHEDMGRPIRRIEIP